jgi:hypothetical protein
MFIWKDILEVRIQLTLSAHLSFLSRLGVNGLAEVAVTTGSGEVKGPAAGGGGARSSSANETVGVAVTTGALGAAETPVAGGANGALDGAESSASGTP